MVPLPLILALVSLAVWLVLTFLRGGFWQLRSFDDDWQTRSDSPVWPRVAVIVPARNEADTISKAVQSLVQQSYSGQFQIIVVDDHSDDNTAILARNAAETANAANPVAILKGGPLPVGWTGKLWALQEGVSKATECAPDYFWFTDADIVHAPDTLSRLTARAVARNCDLVSLMVLLRARTMPERLLIPAFLYFFLKLYPPKWTENKEKRTAAAAGGCLLVRRTALERVGGLASIRSQVIDDCALARAVKRSGGTLWMGLTRKSQSLRSYDTFAEIRDLIARTAFTQLRYSVLLLFGTLLGMLIAYIAPVALAFCARRTVWEIGLLSWVAMTITYIPTVRFYRVSPLWSLALPGAALFYLYATCISAVRYWRGHGGQWKGRTQAPGAKR